MNTPDTFADLVTAWGISRLADDLGIQYVSAAAMRRRNRIHQRYWRSLVELAPQRGISLTADTLIALSATGGRA